MEGVCQDTGGSLRTNEQRVRDCGVYYPSPNLVLPSGRLQGVKLIRVGYPVEV